MHNDRINSVHKLMNKSQHVNKYLGKMGNEQQQQLARQQHEEQVEKQKKEAALREKAKDEADAGAKDQTTDRSSNMRWK